MNLSVASSIWVAKITIIIYSSPLRNNLLPGMHGIYECTYIICNESLSLLCLGQSYMYKTCKLFTQDVTAVVLSV